MPIRDSRTKNAILRSEKYIEHNSLFGVTFYEKQQKSSTKGFQRILVRNKVIEIKYENNAKV